MTTLQQITKKLASRIRAWRQQGVTRTPEQEALDYVEFVAGEMGGKLSTADLRTLKHEIADAIIIEGRSKSDVVQDVLDEMAERFEIRRRV